MKHTILGAGGPVGKELERELLALQKPIRLVSRSPITSSTGTEWVKADLSVREEVFAAIEGSEVAYLTVGFPYLTSVWQQNWPTLMKHVTDACISHGVKMIFPNCVGCIAIRCKNCRTFYRIIGNIGITNLTAFPRTHTCKNTCSRRCT